MSLPAKVKEHPEPAIFRYSLKLLDYERALVFDNDACIGCGLCVYTCPMGEDVIVLGDTDDEKVKVDVSRCVHCGTCDYFCPSGALTLYIEGEPRIMIREPAGELERHSLPDFTGKEIPLKTPGNEGPGKPVRKYLNGSLKIPADLSSGLIDAAIEACPTGAITRKASSEAGTLPVDFNEDKCLFCDACSLATENAIEVTRTHMLMDFSGGVPPLVKRVLEKMLSPKAAMRIIKGTNVKKGMDQARTLMGGSGV